MPREPSSADVPPGRSPGHSGVPAAGICPFRACHRCSRRGRPFPGSQRSRFELPLPGPRPAVIMPSQQKKVIFCTAGVLSFVCALGVVTALGTPLWIKATILCKTGALLVNASGEELGQFTGQLQYGLFHGQGVRQCGLGARPFRFSCE